MERLRDVNPGASGLSRFSPRFLLFLVVLSLPLLNPWVRGDGVGYYAFARALLFQGNLDFTADYQHANEGFREARLDPAGNPRDVFRTSTGHLENHFTVGPAMLWAPFLLCAHVLVLLARAFGSQVTADGFSLPYIVAMALGTLLYGFLALLLSYRVACRFVAERWALLATVAIWWASSLPVYMYFNPSWSHAHSAFIVALFFWYWLRTRECRTTAQWLVLALIAGLALNVYYPNAIVFTALIPEALDSYRAAWKKKPPSETPNDPPGKTLVAPGVAKLLAHHVLFCIVTLLALLPTFLTKYFVYGSLFATGYIPVSRWNWSSPKFLAVLFSSNHGLFSWTPILILAVAGNFLFAWKFKPVGRCVVCILLAFYYFMASYPDWHGISSYGSRFFISLTVFFVLGLAFLLESAAALFRDQAQATAGLRAVMLLFVLWNLGLIFQWGSHMVPARGPISWRQVAYNQFQVVPRRVIADLREYLLRRKEALHKIEERDLQQQDPSSP